MTVEINGIEIDTTSADILRHLHEENGELTTSELRQELGLDRSEPIKYRVREKLEPGKLVVMEQQGVDDTGRHLPHVIRLTDQGEEYMDDFGGDVRESVSDDDLDARVERLERQNERLWAVVSQLRNDLTAAQSDD